MKIVARERCDTCIVAGSNSPCVPLFRNVKTKTTHSLLEIPLNTGEWISRHRGAYHVTPAVAMTTITMKSVAMIISMIDCCHVRYRGY